MRTTIYGASHEPAQVWAGFSDARQCSFSVAGQGTPADDVNVDCGSALSRARSGTA